MSWIDLTFCTNKNKISNPGVDVTIFEKNNVIYGKINIWAPLPPAYTAKFGITVKQISKG